MQQQMESGIVSTAKAAPAAAVVGVQWSGHSVDEWVSMATLAYLALLITHHIWRHWIRPRIYTRTARTRDTDPRIEAPCDDPEG